MEAHDVSIDLEAATYQVVPRSQYLKIASPAQRLMGFLPHGQVDGTATAQLPTTFTESDPRGPLRS
jgi:hypothetical protein